MGQSKYKKLLEEKRIWYKKIGRCYCPILKQEVFFNSKGFYHILYDGFGHGRSNKERMKRLILLPLVPSILKTAVNISEHREPEYHHKTGKTVEYWELRKKINDRKILISVILRRIGQGKIIFFSVWKKKIK